jgi:hypothetical protein
MVVQPLRTLKHTPKSGMWPFLSANEKPSSGVNKLLDPEHFRAAAFGPECVKTPGQTLAMISENLIAGGTHETVYPG